MHLKNVVFIALLVQWPTLEILIFRIEILLVFQNKTITEIIGL